MQQRDLYRDLMVDNVGELTSRLAQAKQRFAKQKVSVKLQHISELERVRTQCTELQRRMEGLEESTDLQMEQNYAAVEIAWNQSMDAVDQLLRGLP